MGRIYTALLAKDFNCRENILFSVEEDASQSNSLSIVMVDNSLRREWRELTRTFPSEATWATWVGQPSESAGALKEIIIDPMGNKLEDVECKQKEKSSDEF